MTTTIVTPDLDAVVAEIQISAPPERVFKALTDAGELQRWFNGGSECPVKLWRMEARVGGQYSFFSEKASIEVNGIREFKCSGEIVECDPPRVLAYTWIGNWHDDPNSSTIVRWELTPTKSGTHVKVTHSGLASLPVARKDYSGGWTGVVEHLKKFVEGRE
jgi:uncharacterized protein YndB with AHSA1/START domain